LEQLHRSAQATQPAAGAAVSAAGSMLSGPIPCSSPQLSVALEVPAAASAAGGGGPTGGVAASSFPAGVLTHMTSSEVSHLRHRLSQLSHDLLTQVLPAAATALAPCSPRQQQQQQGAAVAPDPGVQSGLQWIQAQSAGHDHLMQHMQCMWEQVRMPGGCKRGGGGGVLCESTLPAASLACMDCFC
jgi:hypothetical protein